MLDAPIQLDACRFPTTTLTHSHMHTNAHPHHKECPSTYLISSIALVSVQTLESKAEKGNRRGQGGGQTLQFCKLKSLKEKGQGPIHLISELGQDIMGLLGSQGDVDERRG